MVLNFSYQFVPNSQKRQHSFISHWLKIFFSDPFANFFMFLYLFRAAGLIELDGSFYLFQTIAQPPDIVGYGFWNRIMSQAVPTTNNDNWNALGQGFHASA